MKVTPDEYYSGLWVTGDGELKKAIHIHNENLDALVYEITCYVRECPVEDIE